MKKSGPARATRVDAATKARATLQSIGRQQDRGHAELKLLQRQSQTGQTRQEILAEATHRSKKTKE
jgi:hypothetical protein